MKRQEEDITTKRCLQGSVLPYLIACKFVDINDTPAIVKPRIKPFFG